MALFVPASRAVSVSRNFTTGRPSNTDLGTVVTASATPHALTGTPTELIAATAVEGEWLYLALHSSSTSNTITDGLVNIYIGGAGSETLLIDSLAAGWAGGVSAAAGPRAYWFPLRIPRGSRLSAEYRALVGSTGVTVYAIVGNSNGQHWVGSGVETLGEDTANSRGVSITPGATSEGSWVSIGTTGRRWRYLQRGLMGNNDTSLTAGTLVSDIGSGSAVLQGMEGFFFDADTTAESQSPWDGQGLWCDIPSGTALQMRAQSSGTVSGNQYGLLYGVY